MKRSAEKQITRLDSVEDSDQNPAPGFQKASDSQLAERIIKPLPSRARGPVDQPKSMFAGFSAPNPGSNPFISNSTASVVNSASPSIFSTTPSSGISPKAIGADANLFKPSPPTFTYSPPSSTTLSSSSSGSSGLGSAATNTSKAFASILNAPSTNIFSSPTSNPQPTGSAVPSATSIATNGTSESGLLGYYSKLRGLNHCFVDFIKNKVETDPFADLTSALESYKSHRLKVQKEFDDSSTKENLFASTKPPQPSAQPFQGFGTKQPEFKPPSTTVFGSTPSVNPLSPPKAPASSDSAKPAPSPSTNIFGTTSASSGFLFGSASTTTPVSSASGSSSGFTFGSSTTVNQSTTGTSNIFGSTTSTTLPFPFTSSASSSATPPSNPFGPPATNVFNTSTSSSSEPPAKSAFGNWTNSSNSDKKPTTIAFGSAPAAPKGVSVSHPFGSSPASASTSTSTTPVPFGSEKGSQDAAEEGTGESQSEGGVEGAESTLELLTPNPHDQEGKGEESEETVHAVKLKAYRMRKADEQGGSGWAELGMGILRLKKDKVTGGRRVLLRNSTNGKININFNIYSGLKPSIAKKALTFVGHSEGTSQTYCVRLANEIQAEELKAALEREVEFVKAKETS